VRQANSGVPVQGLRGRPYKFRGDSDQVAMAAFLTAQGFAKYATKEFVARMDEELDCDSIEDLAMLHEDEEYGELGISTEDAEKIGKAAQKELVRRFLAAVPLPNGTLTGEYEKFLTVLWDAGFEEVDDVEDLEAEEAKELGMTAEEAQHLADKADEWGAKDIFVGLLYMFEEADGTRPFREESARSPVLDALLKARLRTLEDLGRAAATDVPGISAVDLAKLQASPRVLETLRKQEL